MCSRWSVKDDQSLPHQSSANPTAVHYKVDNFPSDWCEVARENVTEFLALHYISSANVLFAWSGSNTCRSETNYFFVSIRETTEKTCGGEAENWPQISIQFELWGPGSTNTNTTNFTITPVFLVKSVVITHRYDGAVPGICGFSSHNVRFAWWNVRCILSYKPGLLDNFFPDAKRDLAKEQQAAVYF